MTTMTKTTVALPTEQDTVRLGAKIAGVARRGDIIGLRGDLGAGKTTLARGFVQTLSPTTDEVPSPTFTLVQSYDDADVPVYHFDLYRLISADDVLELGLEDAVAHGIAIVEWPDRLGARTFKNMLDVQLVIDGAGRRATLSAGGTWLERLQGLA